MLDNFHANVLKSSYDDPSKSKSWKLFWAILTYFFDGYRVHCGTRFSSIENCYCPVEGVGELEKVRTFLTKRKKLTSRDPYWQRLNIREKKLNQIDQFRYIKIQS